MIITWLSFTPRYTVARGRQRERIGAHAFRDSAPRSLCGYIDRSRVGEAAGDSDRRCVWCARVAAGESQDRSESGRGWSAPREAVTAATGDER